MLLPLILFGCPFVTDAQWKEAADRDGDGFLSADVEGGNDCDDGDAAVSPDGAEVCNGVDDDCNATIDDGATDAVLWYADPDGDGVGGDADSVSACAAPEGYAAESTDCDDADVTVNPNASEACNSLDDDCDGVIDDGLTLSRWYADDDGDSFGAETDSLDACVVPEGYVADHTDCDDGEAAVNPDAIEVCNGRDDDCDDAIDGDTAADATVYYVDDDGDGYGSSAGTTLDCAVPSGYSETADDCDDADPDAWPNAIEYCDGTDEDCDGTVDEADAVDAQQGHPDADGDGYGDPTATQIACELSSGYVLNDQDCDDGVVSVYPGAPEVCNGEDDDCDGVADAGAVDASAWYTDLDGDGYGDDSTLTTACDPPADGVGVGGDCDDADATRSPGVVEACNDVDDDCGGDVDEGLTTYDWYTDGDMDGFGDPTTAVSDCGAPAGTVSDSTDCDDTDADIAPGTPERCDDVDQDCDGEIDDDPTDPTTWYADTDGDGYGDALSSVDACDVPTGMVADDTDCNDDDFDANPAGTETCTPGDEDCDGLADDADTDAPKSTWYRDADEDTWGVDSDTMEACAAPAGYVELPGDCDDTEATTSPDGVEVCDDVDQDCDGALDDDPIDPSTWYMDADGDMFGDPDVSSLACDQPSGMVADSADCDDTAVAINPTARESCDGIDNNCSGSADEGVMETFFADADADGQGSTAAEADTEACTAPTGYVESADDCDDTDPTVYEGAVEVCDEVDNDCAGDIDEGVTTTYYTDGDNDGYGASPTVQACALPGGYATNNLDCNDSTAAVSPVVIETCNEVDDDCDNVVDEGLTSTVYADADGDTYGDPDVTDLVCTGTVPAGYVSNDDDCNDSSAEAHPGGTEVCDALDNDCNGTTNFGADVPSNYATITLALASSSTPHVCVAAGTYLDRVSTNKAAIIEGWQGSAVTIIDANDGGTAFKFDNAPAGATLRGITLLDGSASIGAGLYVNNTDAIIDDVVIDGASCTATTDPCQGTGAWFVYDNSTVTDLVIRNTTQACGQGSPSNRGGALGLSASSAEFDGLTIEDTTVTIAGNNGAAYGAAIYINDASVPSFDHVTIDDTTVSSGSTTGSVAYGGAVYAATGTATFYHLRVTGSAIEAPSVYGGVLWLSATTGFALTSVALLGNTVGSTSRTTTLEGGVIHVQTGTPVSLTNASVVGTTSSSTANNGLKGGVAYVASSGTLTLDNVDVSGTVASPASGLATVAYQAGATGFTPTYSNFYNNNGLAKYYPTSIDPLLLNGNNLAVAPGYTSTGVGLDPALWDLTLLSTSGLIDVGDPSASLNDASYASPNDARSDIGAMGGPYNDDW